MQYVDIDSLDMDGLDITTHDMEFDADEIAKYADHPLLADKIGDPSVDLLAYSEELETRLRDVESASVEDYVREAGAFQELYDAIEGADGILASMEGLLSGFQEGLGSISDEIRSLQARSVALNIQVSNRKELSAQLQRVVDDMVVSESFIRGIRDDPVNETYMVLLTELNGKIAFTQSDLAANTRAMEDLVPALDQLRLMAVTKIRQFLLDVVFSFRKPKTNVQIVQTGKLLKYKGLYAFLVEHARDVAIEVRSAYETTIAKIYLTYFKWYVGAMVKLQTPIAHKSDLLGVKEGAKRGFFSTKASSKNRALVFSLGERASVLDNINEPATMPDELSGSKYPFEVLFRSVAALVADTATTEYLFDIAFFGKEEVFHCVFDKATQVVTEMLDHYLSSSWDAIGILLCARISHMQQEIMARRSVPALEEFLNAVRLLLWPRFSFVLNKHLESLHELAPETIVGLDVHGCYITRRFAEFVSAIIEVNHGYKDLSLQLQMLTRGMESFLLRASQCLPDPSQAIVFLINNYDLVLSVLDERIPNAKFSRSWRELVQQHIEVFSEELLRSQLNSLVLLVQEVYPTLANIMDAESGDLDADVAAASSSSSPSAPSASERDSRIQAATEEDIQMLRTTLNKLVESVDVVGVADTFAQRWKACLDNLADQVMSTFDNLLCSASVLKFTIGQLVTYYAKFSAIVSSASIPPPSSMVDLHQLRHHCSKFLASKTDFK